MSQKAGSLILIVCSLLLGSSLSLVFSPLLIKFFSLNFLNPTIPGMSPELSVSKTFDILDLFLTLIFSAVLFGINNLKKNNLAVLYLLFFSVTLFLQTHFVFYSSKQVLILFLFFELVYFLLTFFEKKFFSFEEISQNFSSKQSVLLLETGLLMGFGLMLLTNNLLTIPLLSLMWLFFIPFLMVSFKFSLSSKFLNLPIVNIFIKYVNPSILISLLVFNPLFYAGNFDSVEEGFWLAWLQRLSNGEILYKDVAVYHPPLIPWGMYLFSQISGLSIYSERLFLHLLQVLGAIIYFFFAQKLTKNIYFSILSLILFLSFTSAELRNNVEIRLGIGLLSLIFLFKYFEIRKKLYLILSGVITSLSLLLSFEVGLAVFVTLAISLILFSNEKFLFKSKLKEIIFFLSGVLIILIPFFAYLTLSGSLSGFIDQSVFYARAFSQGYFNSPVERSYPQSFFQFHLFNEYLSSNALYWEITKLTFIGILIYGIYKKFIEKNLTAQLSPVLMTSLFGLILTRAALGRSDWFHLLFAFLIASVLIFALLANFYKSQKTLTTVLVFIFVLLISRPWINDSFLQKTFYKYQTYGRVLGDHKNYNFERGKDALLNIDADELAMNNLVSYINSNTSATDQIFVYPWNPEIYFFANRRNSTSFDTPYAFFSDKYQTQMIEELNENNPQLVVLNKDMKFGGLTPNSLQKVNEFITNNYQVKQTFGSFAVLEKK